MHLIICNAKKKIQEKKLNEKLTILNKKEKFFSKQDNI